MERRNLNMIYMLVAMLFATTTAHAQKIIIGGNVYGGGENSKVQGSTTVNINTGFVAKDSIGDGDDASATDEWKATYQDGIKPKQSVFGGGYGSDAVVGGSTTVSISVADANFEAADIAAESYDAHPYGVVDQTFPNVIGGGYNGPVLGETNISVVGLPYIGHLYGGGFYANVGGTNVTLPQGVYDYVYGGGVIGGVVQTTNTLTGVTSSGVANTVIGQSGMDPDISKSNKRIVVRHDVYGANDVSGTVTNAHLSINGGIIYGDVFGAGNGNHTGYTNPEYVEYDESENQDESYGYVQTPDQPDENIKSPVYKYRPRTTHVNLTIAGNAGTNLSDDASVDKVRIKGRTFGGGNSCNVGEWDSEGQYIGGGALNLTIGNHVQLGTLNDSHDDPNGLFMGSNGKQLVAQSDDPELVKYYHHYFDEEALTYVPGFADDDEATFKSLAENILTWTDDVHLNIADDVEDVWMSNFVGGGFRGSMKAKTKDGKFHYSLPEGLTVAHTVIGGAFNAHIDYIKSGSTEPTYSFKGGVLSHNSDDLNDRIHQVHADPKADDAEYATAYFMPLTSGDNAEDDATKAKLYSNNKEEAFVYLDLKCALQPVGIKGTGGDPNSVYGGTVYGGCFESGNIEGDTWVNYGCYLSPLCSNDPLYDVYFNKQNNMGIYGEVSDLDRNNALNIFGAGYGEGTRSMGDVYLCIQSIASQAGGDDDPHGNFPYIFNAFGGSNMGSVDGNVNVYYDSGSQGTLLGSLYGGGLKGIIGGNTFVELAGGFVVNVYGGSRQADIGGASHIWAYDGRYRGAPNSQHLIICNMYGGNDVAGRIVGTMPAAFTATKWKNIKGKRFNSYVEVSADDNNANGGFPLVGRVFAGGNGAEWEDKYGDKPEVDQALIEIDGGTTLQAFGGGNMATITGGTYIFANAATDVFADVTFTDYQKNIMQKVFFNGVPTGYKWDKNRLVMDPFHVVRMFGGNNLADMDIQPTWHLMSGRIANVYSGGNMGAMTYYNPKGKPATQSGNIGEPAGVTNNIDKSNANYNPRGLSITIDQPGIYIGSLFGGCRMSNVNPTPKPGQDEWPEGDDGEDFYGATVNIIDGYIDNVYGGNDISGTVYHGTNVNLAGAVSGNIYGSGNGFYLYKYDKDATALEEKVQEDSDGKTEYLYYTVPGKESASDTEKLLAINAARPSVEKTFLNISGNAKSGANPKRIAYVKGNVYCGGNASTVEGTNCFTKLKIGNYVTLNGVYMGCDGDAYTENEEIAKFAEINGIEDMGAATNPDDFADLEDASHNPILLNVYMKAVDMKALPKGFNLDTLLIEAHIGTFCAGGNRGSMLTDKTVSLKFHNSLLIYDKIVAGCMNANVLYTQKDGSVVESNGGFTRAIADKSTYGNTKMDLTIASHFIPVIMDVPADRKPTTLNSHNENFDKAKEHNFLYSNFSEGEIWDYEEFNTIFDGHWTSQDEFEESGELFIWKEAPGVYAPTCNIYGGCYQSGDIEGDVNIKIHSNMLRYVNKELLEESNASNVACFNVYGAGFGQNSHVWGNVNITMDRCLDTDIMGENIAKSPLVANVRTQFASTTSLFNIKMYTKKLYSAFNGNGANNVDGSYPSANNIFGGGRNGQLIGNAKIEVRNGMVFSDVAGGCYASNMYGSTQVVVGYPKYWQCEKSGEYTLTRGDKWNKGKKDIYGQDLIKERVFYLKGDLVADNVYQQIDDDGNKTDQFSLVEVDPTTYHPTDGTTWDAVHIHIGKGVYGGGYSLANSTAASAGNITTHKLKEGETVEGRELNFDDRYGYDDIDSTVGYGGNSSIMVGDQENGTVDHIRISTLIAKKATIPSGGTVLGTFIKESDGRYTHQGDGPKLSGKTYYYLTGDGGIYGDGHLTFCEGFRAADVTRYGWAEGTPMHPIIMNTFQRLDLLSINDCCLMLQGAQDFATDQLDATTYSITRVNELRMNSTLDPNAKLGVISQQDASVDDESNFDEIHQRNYLAFFNNVRYLGSLVTNDAFDVDHHMFHGADGELESVSYRANKKAFIDIYAGSSKDAVQTAQFKKRNVGTARNVVGVNNGYTLRIQNQEYVGDGDSKISKTYYGPIVGVCEVKLLTLVQGEGGGYVYADNIHEDENHFLNTSGNFVFPGIINQGVDDEGQDIGDQYIVDDCFYNHFGTKNDLTTRSGDLDEAHYWYVEGNKYFFNTTLTAFTYKDPLDFELIKNDPNILLSGMENGSKLNIKKIEWLSSHRTGYETVLQNKTNPDDIEDYEFDIEVGGIGTDAWSNHMPRHSKGTNAKYYTTDKTFNTDELPQFNIRLQDKLDNSGKENYENHLDEPELIKIYLIGQTKDENGNWQTYDYTVTLNIVYLMGPTFEGGVDIENCALPGELIGFSSNGIKIKTPVMMPVTASAWKIVPLSQIDEHGEWKWDVSNGVDIPKSQYSENAMGAISGTIPALYKQNGYNIAFVFTAGAMDFPVFPDQSLPNKEQRMIVVHNYHRMKEVVPQDLQIEKMPIVPNHDPHTNHASYAEAKIYIEDEADLRAFVEYLNMSGTNNIPAGLDGLDIILQQDITLTSALPTISKSFAGTFHGDGYHIDLGEYGTSLFGGKLDGKVYNLGVINGTVASGGTVVNSYVYVDNEDFKSGRLAYQLSHTFNPTTDHNDYDDYVGSYYANGDYQYATTDRAWSLRTGTPNYGKVQSRHDKRHQHDEARWVEEDDVNKPLYDGTITIEDRKEDAGGVDVVYYKGMAEGYANDYLFFGQHLDKQSADAYPTHINQVATGDANETKGGNRVYETTGFYQSKVDQQFYYNKDAWALKSTLTAIDFTTMTAEGDHAATLPTRFSVDSNKDYDGNGSVDGIQYSNANYGHVSQNLLVYNGGSEDEKKVFTYQDKDKSAESTVTYHNIANGSTDYLHLVDKQDFNAPISFNVGTRAWYERQPQAYRNVDGGYDAGSAWEGICLPFTATKVTAEKNGEISHFYGTDELHHEYWLRGLTGVNTVDETEVATFARPAVSGTGCFVDAHQSGTAYSYPANSYFTSLFNYNGHYDTRDDEGDDTMGTHDKAWYAEGHTFADYVPLTAAVPYIVAFPGDDFYEFTMQSYYKTDAYGKVPYPQMATFESGATTIAVTDGNEVTTTIDKTTHHGTYLHQASLLGMNAEGTAFEAGSDVVPFRTYMSVTSPSAPSRTIWIWDGNHSDNDDEPEKPEDELGEYLRIWAVGYDIYVETSAACQLNLYGVDGAQQNILHCQPGVNCFTQPKGGFYLVGDKKLLLKKNNR